MKVNQTGSKDRSFHNRNLKLLRYAMSKGFSECLKDVLTPDAIYETETSGKKYVGAEKIIDRFRYVYNNRDSEYIIYYATITDVDSDNPEYPVGTKCIVLANEEGNYESIAFINVNDQGLISKIKISTDSRYHFKLE